MNDNMRKLSAKQRKKIYARRRTAALLGAVVVLSGVIGLANLAAGAADDNLSGVYAAAGEPVSFVPVTTTSATLIQPYSEWVHTTDGNEPKAIDKFALSDDYPIDMLLYSEYVVLYDVTNERVLFAKNPEDKCYPASTTKIMTSCVALEYTPSDYIFTSGEEQKYVNEGSSLAYFNEGRKADLRMTIEALMLPSGNDAAYVTAANVGRIIGGEDLTTDEALKCFIDKMNERAWDAGAVNTHFANPDGWHDDDHYTTALDLVKLTMYSKKFPMIAEVGKETYVERFYETGEETAWKNSNGLIREASGYYYKYATGLKTGMTDKAGYCVVATAEKDGNELICVAMNASTLADRWSDVHALFKAGFDLIEKEKTEVTAVPEVTTASNETME